MKRWFRDPLVHFLLLGAALFAFDAWRGQGGPSATQIVVGSGQIDFLVAGFTRTWQRPPDEAELKGMLDDWVREEIASREAVQIGLDRDDPVIRRRLRQKLEFLLEDAASSTRPSEAELVAWFEGHRAAYEQPGAVAFRQIFVDGERRGAAAEGEARGILASFRGRDADEIPKSEGDSSMLPGEVALTGLDQVARDFGDAFAKALAAAPVGEWSGPVASSFGWHLVFVRERQEARHPALDEVRGAVERDVVSASRQRHLDELYASLLDKYTVVIEPRAEAKAP